MRLPYHLFIKYLLLTKHTDQEVRDLLKQSSVSDISTVYMNRIRQDELLDCNDHELFQFLKDAQDGVLVKLHRQDLKSEWIDSLSMRECHDATEDFQVAYKCFSDYRKRDYLSLYSLCIDISPERLLELYEKRFGEKLTEESLLVFIKYFADFESMSSLDWERFLRGMTPKLRLLYTIAPGRKIPYIQWRMGDAIDLSPDEVNRALMSDFYFLARDEYTGDARRDGWSERSTKFANIALSAGDRVRNNDSPKRTTKQLIMLFKEEEGEIATYDSVNTGDDPPKIPDSGSDGGGDS